jgi:Na+-driven multidrug efflux pump
MNFNSLIESIIDVGSGFLLAVAIQIFIFPFFGLYPTILDSIGIALIFTVISMLRSWVWRSYFRRRHEME